MKRINALQLRQSLGKVIDLLQKTGEPILLERGRKQAAVLITLEDYQTRFVEKDADQKRRKIQQEIIDMQRTSKQTRSAETILRNIRES